MSKTKTQPLVYLASPYSAKMATDDPGVGWVDPDEECIERRVELAAIATAKLMEQGLRVFSPVVHSHGLVGHLPEHRQMDHDFWMTQDLEILRACDVVLCLPLMGWEFSRGMQAEQEAAKQSGIPVVRIWHLLYVDRPDKDTWPAASIARIIQDKNIQHGVEPASQSYGPLEDDEAIAQTFAPLSEPENILEEALNLTEGARNDDYGHPYHDFTRTAGMWSALFDDRLLEPLEPQDVAMAMICVKLSREMNKAKRDNRVDMAGYANTLQMVWEYIEDHGTKTQ